MVGWLKTKARELGRRPAALLKGYAAKDGGGGGGRGREAAGAGAGAGGVSRSTLAGQVGVRGAREG